MHGQPPSTAAQGAESSTGQVSFRSAERCLEYALCSQLSEAMCQHRPHADASGQQPPGCYAAQCKTWLPQLSIEAAGFAFCSTCPFRDMILNSTERNLSLWQVALNRSLGEQSSVCDCHGIQHSPSIAFTRTSQCVVQHHSSKRSKTPFDLTRVSISRSILLSSGQFVPAEFRMCEGMLRTDLVHHHQDPHPAHGFTATGIRNVDLLVGLETGIDLDTRGFTGIQNADLTDIQEKVRSYPLPRRELSARVTY